MCVHCDSDRRDWIIGYLWQLGKTATAATLCRELDIPAVCIDDMLDELMSDGVVDRYTDGVIALYALSPRWRAAHESALHTCVARR